MVAKAEVLGHEDTVVHVERLRYGERSVRIFSRLYGEQSEEVHRHACQRRRICAKRIEVKTQTTRNEEHRDDEAVADS